METYTAGPGHVAYIEDDGGEYSWHCADIKCMEATGFETPSEAVKAAAAAGHPLAADAHVPDAPYADED